MVRPEIWSTSLRVRSRRSRPAPVSKRFEVFEQRRTHQLEAAQMVGVEQPATQAFKLAGFGRQDVLDVSGRTQRMKENQPKKEKSQTQRDRSESDEADLAIGEFRHSPECFTPGGWRYKGSRPSSTSMSAKAISRELFISSRSCHPSHCEDSGRSRFRLDHQHVTLAGSSADRPPGCGRRRRIPDPS